MLDSGLSFNHQWSPLTLVSRVFRSCDFPLDQVAWLPTGRPGISDVVFHLNTPGKLDYKNVLKKEQLVTSSDYLSADGGCQVIIGFPAPKPRD